MDASELANSMEPNAVCSQTNSNPQQAGHEEAINKASHHQDLVLSNDGFHWCAEMDYQFAWSTHSPLKGIYDNTNSEISFTSNSDSSVSTGRYKNFDIHLAQIDIETFKSEDIERITHNSYPNQNDDSTDTLRIVESLRSLNVANDATTKHLQLPSEECAAISIDSLDLSLDNEINERLLQKCSERDKTRYKIAMIDTSVHSQMQNSAMSTNSDFDSPVNNNNYLGANGSNVQLNLKLARDAKCVNPFISSVPRSDNTKEAATNVDTIQSPGSLVQMFIQNKICSNENSVDGLIHNGNYLNENLSKCDISNCNNVFARQQSQASESYSNYVIDEMDQNSTANSLNTVDSNELPLHVLDLSKKLRSMNMSKQMRLYGSTSMSTNTSYTSTTTSSSATNCDRRRPPHNNSCSTNPFLQTYDNKRTRTTSTQFPELFQDKQVQASFEEDECREAPVLVYYPNYSLPDLSFLQDIFKGDKSKQPIYLSPVKHEPPKMATQTSATGSAVNRRIPSSDSAPRKCRPKSYADYETLLSQDFSHIKDWDSLNLLLPDDFKEFIEKNNLLNLGTSCHTSNYTNEHSCSNQSYPMKSAIPTSRAMQNVKLRPHRRQQQPSNKRYSLQEANNFDANNHPAYRYHPSQMESNFANYANSSMTRSQTMPNCGLPVNSHHHSPMPYYGPNGNYLHNHNCCHPPCCHSGCHSPSFHSSQSSPQKPSSNFSWDMLSSSSFKKLLSFLSKLDECSSEHSETETRLKGGNFTTNGINEQKSANINPKILKNTGHEHNSSKMADPIKEKLKIRTPPARLDLNKNRATKSAVNKTVASAKINSHSKATSPMTTNRDVSNRKHAPTSEKTKIILKRPTTLHKNAASSNPVPKTRTSSKSMIPVHKNTPLKDYGAKDRLANGLNTQF